MMWLPFALPIHLLIRDPNLVGILTLLILYVQFIWLVRQWGRTVHRRPQVLRSYGLEFSRRNGLLVLRGLGVGLLCVVTVIGLEIAVGWVEWRSPTWVIIRIVLEGLLISLAIGFAEELLFRGWMLDELQRDYAPLVALWANAIFFAAIHLRLWTFPALVLLGIALVWAKRSHTHVHLGKRYELLGLPIGLHAGLVWGNYIFEVGQLIEYRDQVPAWVTGIDRNPLAGLVGVLLMGVLAFGLWRYATLHIRHTSPKLYSTQHSNPKV